jgi:hypothetical protein
LLLLPLPLIEFRLLFLSLLSLKIRLDPSILLPDLVELVVRRDITPASGISGVAGPEHRFPKSVSRLAEVAVGKTLLLSRCATGEKSCREDKESFHGDATLLNTPCRASGNCPGRACSPPLANEGSPAGTPVTGIAPQRPDDQQGPRQKEESQGPNAIRHWLPFWMPVQRSSGHPPEFEVEMKAWTPQQ